MNLNLGGKDIVISVPPDEKSQETDDNSSPISADNPAMSPLTEEQSDSVPQESVVKLYRFWTPEAGRQIQGAIDEGKIPFANDTLGLAFLLLLLQSCGGFITSFYMTSKGRPLVNCKLPGEGGISSIAWRIWKVAARFPDKVSYLGANLPGVLFSSDVTIESLDPQVRGIINQLESLEPDIDGNVTYRVPKDLVELIKQSGQHNLDAVDGLIRALFGENLLLVDVRLSQGPPGPENPDIICLTSVSKEARCPCCGQISIRTAGGGGVRPKPRIVSGRPMRWGYPTKVVIDGVKNYVCENPECTTQRFSETFDFVLPYKQFSVQLMGTVLAMAALTSYHGGEEMWKQCGIWISDDTISRMVRGLTFEDDPDVEKIGVDDVAKRKGVSYYTIVYDLADHRLLGIVDGRDGSELIKWLEKHNKVKVIARDRASAYSSAIDKWATANGCNVTEIADRFHLIQNMIEHIKKYCLSSLPLRFAIIVNGNSASIVEGDEIPHKKAFAKGEKPMQERLDCMDVDNSPPMDANGNLIEFEVIVDERGNTENDPEGTTSSLEEPSPSEERIGNEPASAITPGRPLSKVDQDRNVDLYCLICVIRSDVDPALPKKEQYLELAKKHHLTQKEVSRYCRMKQAEVEALLDGVDPNRKEEVKATYGLAADQYDIACAVREVFDPAKPKNAQYQALAEKYKTDARTVGRYCRMTPEEVEALKDSTTAGTVKDKPRKPGKKRARRIDCVKYIIYKLLVCGHTVGDIFWKIKGMKDPATGKDLCTLTDEGLIKGILTIHKIAFPSIPAPDASQYLDVKYEDGVYVIRRCELLKYLVTVNPKTKKNKILETYEPLILDRFYSVREVQTMFKDFHSAIMGDDEKAIDRFIAKYKDGVLRNFCRSLSQDLEQVKNAVRYTYSSGPVEGGNSKFKNLKRISGGRLQLNSLSQKCKLGFWSTLDGFKLSDVAHWLK